MIKKEIHIIDITIEELINEISTIVIEQINSQASKCNENHIEYLSREEVANFFKTDISTIIRWTKQGKLIAYGMGKRVYYNRSEIENSLIRLN